MGDAKTYSGGCHCGRVRYEVTTDLAKLFECNCSICGRVGAVRTFVPAAQFKLLSGADALVDYRFGKERIDHTFCASCGVHSFAKGKGRDGSDTVSVNVRCLDGVDVWSLSPQRFDGKSL